MDTYMMAELSNLGSTIEFSRTDRRFVKDILAELQGCVRCKARANKKLDSREFEFGEEVL